MRPPLISVVGRSHSGKTTLLEKLIVELKERGYKVAVIKHAGELNMDTKQKDSWRFIQAGSEGVIVSSPEEFAIIKRTDHDLDPYELARFVQWDCDLILTEGFKKSDTHKIEIHRKEQGKGLVSLVQHLIAIVSDEPFDLVVPQFTKEQVKPLVDLIEEYIKNRSVEDKQDKHISSRSNA